jgi:hypothetical protein
MGSPGLVFIVLAGAFLLACGLAGFTVGLAERHLRTATRRHGT